MSELDKCPELEHLHEYIEFQRPIPPPFVAHAARCMTCLFWLSHVLAIADVYYTLDRRKKDMHCPKKEVFRDALFVVIRTERIIDPSHKPGHEPGPDARKSIMAVGAHDLGKFAAFWDHLGACPLCHHYYDTLYEKVGSTQQHYEKAIKSREELVPICEDMSFEIDVV